MCVAVQSQWLLCGVAAVWVSVTTCSPSNRTVTLLLYEIWDWLCKKSICTNGFISVELRGTKTKRYLVKMFFSQM